jgi:hypothetical protein
MNFENESAVDVVRDGAPSQHSRGRYEPPRVVKSRTLGEVTGQGAVVPSGAPRPVD